MFSYLKATPLPPAPRSLVLGGLGAWEAGRLGSEPQDGTARGGRGLLAAVLGVTGGDYRGGNS